MTKVYLGLGANVGNAAEQIQQAIVLLSEKAKLVAQAPLYVTRPYGLADQPDFLNGAVAIETELGLEELRTFTKEIEDRLGRVRGVRNGPRSIDIDILLYGNVVRDEPELKVPHRDLTRRDFVLRPLLDLDSELLDPVSGRRLRECLEAIPENDCYILGVAATI
jgi:2-amino-4-hydroxy-6-hydroxymethyldihydropteridine diphosphokinase